MLVSGDFQIADESVFSVSGMPYAMCHQQLKLKPITFNNVKSKTERTKALVKFNLSSELQNWRNKRKHNYTMRSS